jgi:nucleotide-binding universal stress UspA family protein
VYDQILVPTDGSDAMETVYEHAADLAEQYDATVHVVYVVDKRAFLTLDDEMKADVETELREQGEAAVAAAADRLEAAGATTMTECRSGDPADEILAAIAETGADLVVMGTQRGDYQQSMLGSVSRKVTEETTAPVLTVTLTGGA